MNSIKVLLTLGLMLFSTGYDHLADQSFDDCKVSHVEIKHGSFIFPLKYTFCSDKISHDFMVSNVVQSSIDVLAFMEKEGYTVGECRSNKSLEVYEVSVPVLNSARFEFWHSMNKNRKIWGLFDPRIHEPEVSSIMITNHGEEWNKLLIAHELSHYWYDRFCTNLYWDKSTEAFALSFEDYLRSKNDN